MPRKTKYTPERLQAAGDKAVEKNPVDSASSLECRCGLTIINYVVPSNSFAFYV